MLHMHENRARNTIGFLARFRTLTQTVKNDGANENFSLDLMNELRRRNRSEVDERTDF